MKGEIDRNFYCCGDHYRYDILGKKNCTNPNNTNSCCCYGSCTYYRHKWPTPEQYEIEYGEKYPDRGAVYRLGPTAWNPKWIWQPDDYSHSVLCKFICIIACTPWGNPPDDWVPLNE